jgi:hypothetical protein
MSLVMGMDSRYTIGKSHPRPCRHLPTPEKQGGRDRSQRRGRSFGMAIDTETRASRRNILAAALGGLGGLLAGRLGSPESVRAGDGGNAVLGTANTGNTETSFENMDPAETSLKGYHATSGKGVEAAMAGTGYGLYATASATGGRAVYASSLDKAGVTGLSTAAGDPLNHVPGENVGVLGAAGDLTDISTDLSETGVYGFCDTSPDWAAGVWGDSVQGTGVVGTGDWGVFGGGYFGVRALGTYGVVTSGTIALHTTGRIVFSGRSGHATITAGHYYRDVAIAGMPSSADVIATLRTRKSGYYIAAVASYAGKFRIYLNKTATSSIAFNYLVLN